MRKSRFTEAQIIGMIKEQEAGLPTSELCRKHGLTDVALGSDGRLFVADGYGDRVQVFGPDGTFSHKWGGPFAMNIFGPFQGWFATVTSIAIGPEDNVFVTDFYNDRVQKFAPDGTFLTAFGETGTGLGELRHAMAVAVTEDGSVFVADFLNNRIQKWLPRQ